MRTKEGIHAGDEVGTVIAVAVEILVRPSRDREGYTTLKEGDRRDLPTIGQLLLPTVPALVVIQGPDT